MAVHSSLERLCPVFLLASVVLSLAVITAPARAGHYQTHPTVDSTTATVSAADLTAQAIGQATGRAATQNQAKSSSQASTRAAALFHRGAKINVNKDAYLYITSRSIPKNAPLLEEYSTGRPNGGRVQARSGEAATVPGLLGIATQVHRAQDQNSQAYSLADAMRDAIWRKRTAARLKALTIVSSACVGSGDTATKRVPPIDLDATC